MRRSLPDIETQAQSKVTRPGNAPIIRDGLIFLGLFVVWVAVSWPAFAEFWWHADDYTRAVSFDPWFSVGQGRPFEILVPYLMNWDRVLQSPLFHQAIRLLQVALHVLTVLLLMRLFARLVDWRIALGAVLFFAFWPFHAEAVLWVSAFAYPWAAAVSLWGALLIVTPHRRQRWWGALLVVGAMFINQSAALAALVAWAIYQALFVIRQKQFDPYWRAQAIGLGLAYLVGALSGRLMIIGVLHDTGRATLTSSLADKVAFWLELNRQYVASPNYPSLLTALMIVLPLIVGLLAFNRWWRGLWQWRQSVATLLLFVLLTFLPYSIVLLTSESSPAWRILYLAPLLSVAVWLVGQELLQPYPIARYVSVGVLALFLAIALPMNRWNAADYVAVFRQDMATLRSIESAAATHEPPLHHLVVATYPDYLRTWDLYDVTYMHYDSKKSAFLRDWTVIPLLEEFSTLAPWPIPGDSLHQDPPRLQACVALCLADGEAQPWQILVLPDAESLCVCP